MIPRDISRQLFPRSAGAPIVKPQCLLSARSRSLWLGITTLGLSTCLGPVLLLVPHPSPLSVYGGSKSASGHPLGPRATLEWPLQSPRAPPARGVPRSRSWLTGCTPRFGPFWAYCGHLQGPEERARSVNQIGPRCPRAPCGRLRGGGGGAHGGC